MWCKGCRQDVPALPFGEKQKLCCPRCGEILRAEPQPPTGGNGPSLRASEVETISLNAMSEPPAYDGWQLDEALQHIHRVLHAGRMTDAEPEAVARHQRGLAPFAAERPEGCSAQSVPLPFAAQAAECPHFRVGQQRAAPFHAQAARFDPPQGGPPARHVPGSSRPGKRRKRTGRRGAISSLLTWFVFTLGIASSACGGILLGWSLAGGRQDLWNVGLPVALVGQIALLAGLVLQIDRLWHDNRAAASKLDDVDQQIHKLETTTMLLGAGQGSASAAFYTHLARGAGPQLLLTDLKSQLDLLAMKIARET
jgi:hypothetical protein